MHQGYPLFHRKQRLKFEIEALFRLVMLYTDTKKTHIIVKSIHSSHRSESKTHHCKVNAFVTQNLKFKSKVSQSGLGLGVTPGLYIIFKTYYYVSKLILTTNFLLQFCILHIDCRLPFSPSACVLKYRLTGLSRFIIFGIIISDV